MNDREIFRRNLARYISESGMNQKEIAEKLDVSKATVSAWITGRGYPRVDVMEKLSILFNVQLSDIVSDDNSEETEESKLIALFRSLNSTGKAKMFERAEELAVLYGDITSKKGR